MTTVIVPSNEKPIQTIPNCHPGVLGWRSCQLSAVAVLQCLACHHYRYSPTGDSPVQCSGEPSSSCVASDCRLAEPLNETPRCRRRHPYRYIKAHKSLHKSSKRFSFRIYQLNKTSNEDDRTLVEAIGYAFFFLIFHSLMQSKIRKVFCNPFVKSCEVFLGKMNRKIRIIDRRPIYTKARFHYRGHCWR